MRVVKLLIGALLIVVSSFSIGICDETQDILVALSRLSVVKIPKANLHCELNGSQVSADDTFILNDVTVADVFAHYAAWALSDNAYKTQSFKCEGKNIKKCSWEFGEKENPSSPGWQLFLNFDFNPKTGQVLPASLECVNVP